MKRREFIRLLGGAAVAWPLSAHAQQAEKFHRVGMLETTPATLNSANVNAFREGMREFGYVEGKNLTIEYRSAGGQIELLPSIAAELVQLNMDVILTRGTAGALAAKNATKTIPIVLTGIGDPVGNGIVASLAQPGGNITGLSASTTELQAKRLELLSEMVPLTTRFAGLFNLGDSNDQLNWRELEKAAGMLGVSLQRLDVRKAEELERAFNNASEQHAEGLIVSLNALMSANRTPIAVLAARHRLPAVYSSREFVESCGLMSYGVNFPNIYHRAAEYVDRIFKGANPGNLPVMQPTKFEFVLNLKTARSLGTNIPPSILLRADEMIE